MLQLRKIASRLRNAKCLLIFGKSQSQVNYSVTLLTDWSQVFSYEKISLIRSQGWLASNVDAWARHAIFLRRKEDYVTSFRRRPKDDGKERRKADESTLQVILKDAEQNWEQKLYCMTTLFLLASHRATNAAKTLLKDIYFAPYTFQSKYQTYYCKIAAS